MYLSIALAEQWWNALSSSERLREKEQTLTNNRFYIFLSSRHAAICLERAPCAESEGQCFVVLPKVIIHFARDKSSDIACSLSKLVAFVQRLTESTDCQTQDASKRALRT